MQFHVATMIGRAALRLVDRLGSIGLLLYQVASCMWSGQFRMRVLVEQIAKIGVQSQPVVIITGAFTGAVLEAQTLFQLQTVRMETMGGAVVAVGMFRELGPVITGLMLAGRVGSAMARGNRHHESHGTGGCPQLHECGSGRLPGEAADTAMLISCPF